MLQEQKTLIIRQTAYADSDIKISIASIIKNRKFQSRNLKKEER
jgi:hypothetical protein